MVFQIFINIINDHLKPNLLWIQNLKKTIGWISKLWVQLVLGFKEKNNLTIKWIKKAHWSKSSKYQMSFEIIWNSPKKWCKENIAQKKIQSQSKYLIKPKNPCKMKQQIQKKNHTKKNPNKPKIHPLSHKNQITWTTKIIDPLLFKKG